MCLFLRASISLMPFSTSLAFDSLTADRYITARMPDPPHPSFHNDEQREDDIRPNYGDLINANKYLLSIPHLIYTLQHKQTVTQPLIYAWMSRTMSLCWQHVFFSSFYCCLLVAGMIGGVVGGMAILVIGLVVVLLLVRHKLPRTQGEEWKFGETCKNRYTHIGPLYIFVVQSGPP